RTGGCQLGSLTYDGTRGGLRPSLAPVFRPSGRWLMFQTQGGGLTATGSAGIVVRDLMANKTLQVDDNGIQPAAVFSPDSRFVAHHVRSQTGAIRNIELFDLFAGTNALVCEECDSPSVSGDGRWVAYRSRRISEPNRDVFVRDMRSDR